MPKTSRMLIAIVLALVSLGIVMLASTSSVRGSATFQDPHYFLKRQLVWLALALMLGAVVSRIDYHRYQRLSLPLGLLAVALLILVLIPGVGREIGGSRRWLRFGPLSIQPSELGKLAVIVCLASWLTYVKRRAARIKEGLILPMAGLGIVLLLMLLEPDFGTTLLTGMVGFLILFAGGAPLHGLLVTGVLGLSAFILAVMHNPVRLGRIKAFLNPADYPVTAHHLEQSKVAFIRGGPTGVGLGNSIQKHFYLPEAHNDFILAIIGEELGFVATGAVLLLFAGLLICGLVITFHARDVFGRLLAFGLTMTLVVQAAINFGVVTGCLPTKGLPLPFISYGGTSLLVSVVSICVLLNIAEHAAPDQEDEHTRTIKDRAHRL